MKTNIVSLTSTDLRKELDKTDCYGLSLRKFLEKVLDRMIELETFIAELEAIKSNES